jgi:hypothetical protein
VWVTRRQLTLQGGFRIIFTLNFTDDENQFNYFITTSINHGGDNIEWQQIQNEIDRK